MAKTQSPTQARMFVSEPYREVCYGCGNRKQVVAVHVPLNLTTGAVNSTRLCHSCSLELARLLLASQVESDH